MFSLKIINDIGPGSPSSDLDFKIIGGNQLAGVSGSFLTIINDCETNLTGISASEAFSVSYLEGKVEFSNLP